MSDDGDLTITATWAGSDVVLRLSGDLDLAASAGWDASIDEVMGQLPTAITVDLGPTTFVDSSGLRLLVLLTQAARARGTQFQLINVPSSVLRLLQITGLSEMLSVVPEPT